MKVEVKGIRETQARLRELSERLYSDEAQSLFTTAARQVATSVRRLAPVGTRVHSYKPAKRNFRVFYIPGTLRKAIVGKGFRSLWARLKFGPGAYAQVNLKRRYMNTAPYGHIVESGRRTWRPFRGREYFKRGVENVGPAQLERLTAAYKRLIERRYR